MLKNEEMIEKSVVRQIVDEFISGTNYFVVDVNVSADNQILIELDSEDGFSIDACAELTKFVESKLDREVEDYELEVGSPGLSTPFKVLEQYKKYIGSEVDVLDNENTKWQGVLLSADEQQFVIEITYKAKPEGAKRKIDVTENITFTYDKIKYTKYTIRFK